MATKVTKLYVRSNCDLPFYARPAEEVDYMNKTYNQSGNVVLERNLSEDGHELTVTRTFLTYQHYVDFLSDPIVQKGKNERIQYNEDNAVVEYPAVVEEV